MESKEPPPLPEKKSSSSFYKVLIGSGIVIIVVLSGLSLFGSKKPVPPQTKEPISIQPTPVPFFLHLDQRDQTSTVNDELFISGQTFPNTTVIVFSDTDQTSLESDTQGKFETTVLVPENATVKVTAFAENGEEISQTITVTSSI